MHKPSHCLTYGLTLFAIDFPIIFLWSKFCYQKQTVSLQSNLEKVAHIITSLMDLCTAN